MKKAYLIAAVSLGVFAAPQAQAQLLGGSGGIGGQLGGTLSGASGPLSKPTETLRSSTRGSARGDARTTGSQRVDRRRGSVAVDRSLAGSLDVAGAKTIETPKRSSTASGSGSGSAAGSGSANAQLIGTDAVRDVTGRAVGKARDVATTTRDRASGAVNNARSLSGSASGSGSANGQGSASIGSGMLAAAGSGAAAGDGAFTVHPGMPVLAPSGERFGKVRQLITDSRGRVTGVLVRAKDRDVTIPSTHLSGSGNALLMGQGTLSATHPAKPDQPAS